MVRFKGEAKETITVQASLEDAAQHFSDLETIIRNYGPLKEHSILDEHTIHFTLIPQANKGVEYRAEYQCRYELVSPDRLEWRTVQTDNMWSKGHAQFTSLGGGRTRVEYFHDLEMEMKVNRLLAKVIKPIITHQIKVGVKGYLQRMKDDLEK